MKITGGIAKGVYLKTSKSQHLRPATDCLRQSIFSSLGSCVQGANVLDLFAGTGSYALEALSRGASSITCVEKDKKISLLIRDNLKSVCKSIGLNESCASIYNYDVLKYKPHALFDLVFMDPPYLLFESFVLNPYWLQIETFLNDGEYSRLILEHPSHVKSPDIPNLSCYKQLGKLNGQKGTPCVSLYCRI